ncbi:glycosyltransferase family 2 protein [Maribellus maritimus]|uniref:glycosyltransferase family 2 protein n=1 Tax=Maribellus maritimus TaxID=2870838 RepID=UPI001EEA00C0|nr:glycosyltransferase family A protein [Maribellus maritimus]MCG6188966.1 glycosyltransferase family 2 protein [Maribellus maritimus]
MNQKTDIFLAFCGTTETQKLVSEFRAIKEVKQIFIVAPEAVQIQDAETLVSSTPLSTSFIKQMAQKSKAEFAFIALQNTPLEIGQFSLERLINIAKNTEAAMVYSDYTEIINGERINHPVIDYQEGSLRDDFNFGPVQFYRSNVLKSFAEDEFSMAGYYAFRLHASRFGELIRIPEFLFTMVETDTRKSGEKQFDYVSNLAREKQIEMEKACTSHLIKTGAFLQPPFKKIDFSEENFPVEASVVIPVRNRIKTIKDAVNSVLQQKTNFKFNLIVVDNYSTDGTTEILAGFAKAGELFHLVPERKDLGIGGCWNEAIFNKNCGQFAIQLDSDDLYNSENTLQKIVDQFYEDKCAMVIGSYQMTNFALEEIPPGIIDHKEWTPENGPNNALRINGLGAPRAFYTPVLRKIKVPNVSYGEDYAVGLAISREYKIGRIYEPLYLCRRWEDNTDSSLDINKLNMHNLYKDRIRTIELKTRLRQLGNRSNSRQ